MTHGYQPNKPAGMGSTKIAPPPKRLSIDPTRGVLDEIYQERRRQLDEGYDAEHDDTHSEGEIAAYAACMALPPDYRYTHVVEALTPVDWNTPVYSGRRRDLIKSVAMLVAEVERLDRVEQGRR